MSPAKKSTTPAAPATAETMPPAQLVQSFLDALTAAAPSAVEEHEELIRNFVAAMAAAATPAAAMPTAEAASAQASAPASAREAAQPAPAPDQVNPYGGGPGTGITLPPYYKPTPSVRSRSNYFPGSEQLGPDEMRISFMGSCPFPPRHDQAGTCIMVELGSGDRFFFDFGPGCLRNILAMGVPIQTIRHFFITHLHADHYVELAYLLPFRAYMFGGWKPLEVTGPSGRTPELGTKAMIENMKKMLRWNLEAFDTAPIGDGYEVEVNEFDYCEENAVCYVNNNGVVVRHWPRLHNKDGASAYRLDWNGLSFVWTGDGRPDDLTAKCAEGADVFVTEIQADVASLIQAKYGMPPALYNFTIDVAHTPHYAAGYLMKQVNPRIGMVTHMEYDQDLLTEYIAGIRTHWDGMFAFGAPDGQVVNVTKDAIWIRSAALPGLGGMSPATPLEMFGEDGKLPKEITIPQPRTTFADATSPEIRAIETDPHKYYPPQVYREPVQTYSGPTGVIDLAKVMGAPPARP